MLRNIGASSVLALEFSNVAKLAASVLSSLGLFRLDSLVSSQQAFVSCRGHSTATPVHEPAKGISGPSGTPATSSPAASEAAATSKRDVDDDKLPLDFSLRPSALSPLYASWERSRRVSQRIDHLTYQLRAHSLLASSFDGKTATAVTRRVKHRVESIQQAARQLRVLLDESHHVTSCPSPDLAVAYCASLEASAALADPGASNFARVQRGEVSPWAHYAQHFQGPYANAPRLEPLEVIFAKPDPEELVRQIRATARQAGAAAAKTGTSKSGLPAGVIGPHIDVAGVTHSAGKRKTSSATLDLVPGSGQFTVNGLPLASYFRDLDARRHALEPLFATGFETKYNISVKVRGGGVSGQAQAVRTAVARALCVQQPMLVDRLADMTRWDGRVVERKKPGRPKARAGFTWVKR